MAALPPAASPKSEYEEGVGLLKQGQYDAAEKSFAEFVAKNPKSALVPSAVLNLGETYYLRGRHREAAEQFLKISTAYPASNRAPEAMLRLGQSLNAIGGAKEQACAAFGEVGRKISERAGQYPGGGGERGQEKPVLMGSHPEERSARVRLKGGAASATLSLNKLLGRKEIGPAFWTAARFSRLSPKQEGCSWPFPVAQFRRAHAARFVLVAQRRDGN